MIGKTHGEPPVGSAPLREVIDQLDRGGTERGVIDVLTDVANKIDVRFEGLESENAVLIRLATALHYCGLPDATCDKCAMNGADPYTILDKRSFCDEVNGLFNKFVKMHERKAR